ncbi:MAG: hypothetical protein AAF184_09565 [Pseudomonadota bacterium]
MSNKIKPLNGAHTHTPLARSVRTALRTRLPSLIVPAATVGLAVLAPAANAQLSGFPPSFPLTDLWPDFGGDGSEGVVFQGQIWDNAGTGVDGGVDLNGDGVDDLLIGAGAFRGYFATSTPGDGYVVFGREAPFPALVELGEFREAMGDDGSEAVVVRGVEDFDNLAWRFRSAGDFNGDGLGDLIATAPGGDRGEERSVGGAYLVFGRASGFDGAEFNLSGLLPREGGDGSDGTVIIGLDRSNSLGLSLDADCDVNGDGLADVVLGSRYGDVGATQGAGNTFVMLGRTDTQSVIDVRRLLPENGGNGTGGFELSADGEFDGYGEAVNCSADLNADGFDDIVIAPNGWDLDVPTYVVYGRAAFPPTFSLTDLLAENGGDGSEGTALRYEGSPGPTLSSAGDVNYDGVEDLLIGVQAEDQAFVVFGRRGGFGVDLALADLLPENGGDGSQGIVFQGAVRTSTGTVVARAGDVDGDGVGDFLVGAQDSPSGNFDGPAMLVFGRPGGFPAQIEFGQVGDSTEQVVFEADLFFDGANADAAGPAGDVNGDGIDDLVFGAYTGGLFDFLGRAHLVFGRAGDRDDDGISNPADNCSFTRNGAQRDTDGDGFGNICDADLNGDCQVTRADLVEVFRAIGTENPDADLNGDDVVNGIDLSIARAAIGRPPGPSGASHGCDD